jgi:hypothetical protein
MKHTDSSLSRASSPGWQILGELELTVNPDTDHTVGKWLAMILSPIDLPADFLNKVLKSAQEAAARAMQSETVMKFDHTHLLVLAPQDHVSKGQTWGFFRIEKIEGAKADESPPDHAIEFYLYLDG